LHRGTLQDDLALGMAVAIAKIPILGGIDSEKCLLRAILPVLDAMVCRPQMKYPLAEDP
jgi:hypothetical protein